MDKKLFGIGILSITAVGLLIANLMAPRHVDAMESIKDRDYSLVTARMQGGGEALVVVDNNLGMMAVFTYERGRVDVRGVKSVGDAFGANIGGGRR